MTEEHYIEWIEVVTEDGKSNTKYLNPGDDPEATFCVDVEGTVARAYCNLHGHWKS
jgi:superoxide reductase